MAVLSTCENDDGSKNASKNRFKTVTIELLCTML
jgi:hypothetical protein